MAQADTTFQPGKILHDSIVGAFRSQGRTMQRWCAENGVNVQIARQSTHGQSQGPKGTELLSRMIEAAGVDLVGASYRYRMLAEVEKLAPQPTAAAA